MTRKPARMYREIEGQVYTRREYMGGVPVCRVTQFDTGNLRTAFPWALSLATEEAAQVRDVALESARVSAVRVLEKAAPNEYHLKVRRFPHQILREHKMATGAGADRISDWDATGVREGRGPRGPRRDRGRAPYHLHDGGSPRGREGSAAQGLPQAPHPDAGDVQGSGGFVAEGRTTSTGHGACDTSAAEVLPSRIRFAVDNPRDPTTRRSVGLLARWARISSTMGPS